MTANLSAVVLPSLGQSVALLVIAGAALAWLGWGLGAPRRLLAAVLCWQGLMGALAVAGYFNRFDQPWRALPTVALSVAAAMWLARRPLPQHELVPTPVPSAEATHRSLGHWLSAAPLWAWVALQAFRLPLELLLYSLFTRGVIGPQMSFAGYNFDVLMGLSALPLAAWVAVRSRTSAHDAQRHTGPDHTLRRVLIAWNSLGLGLLLTVVVISVLSIPFAFQVFTSEPANRVLGQFPFVWIATLLVPLALLGHVVVLRRLAWPK